MRRALGMEARGKEIDIVLRTSQTRFLEKVRNLQKLSPTASGMFVCDKAFFGGLILYSGKNSDKTSGRWK